MKLKHKISLLVIGILLVVSLLISSSYALWVFSVSQESTNVLVSDCFEITLTDNNPIGLAASFPMRDSDGVQTTPYTFTIKNICNHPTDFQINLETLNTSTIDESFIKADLNGHITEYNAAESVEPTIDDAKSAVMLYEDTLTVNSSKTYNLRLWINENATQEDVENKSYTSKISVTATVRKQYAEGTLIDGEEFNAAIKKLADGDGATYIDANTSITSIEWSNSAPQERNNAVNIAKTSTKTPIYAWFKDGTIYINSELDKIYMNQYSSYMFNNLQGVTSLDLSHFDTSNVVNMYSMFSGMSSLTNLDVSHFDTSNVTNMSWMFSSMSNLTSLDVSHFNTTNVKSMPCMFYNMSNLTSLDVSHFNTSNVTEMQSMFNGMNSLTSLDVSHFNTSKVTNMYHMFSGMSNLTSLDVSHFSTTNVTNMGGMFNEMSNLTSLDLSSFDTSKVTSMSHMFNGMSNLTSLDISDFDTSKVTNMAGMFNGMSNLTILNLSHFDTSNVTDMSYMFNEMSNLTSLDLSSFDTSNVEIMDWMFSGMSNLTNIDLSSFDTSNVTDMTSMFTWVDSLTSLDLSSFDTSNTTNMSHMFYGMDSIITIFVGNNWSTEGIMGAKGDYMFSGDSKLVGGSGTTYNRSHTDKEYARVDDPANGKPGYFTLKTN